MNTKTLVIGGLVVVALGVGGYIIYKNVLAKPAETGARWTVGSTFTIQPTGMSAITVAVLAVSWDAAEKQWLYQLGVVATGGMLPGWWRESDLISWLVT